MHTKWKLYFLNGASCVHAEKANPIYHHSLPTLSLTGGRAATHSADNNVCCSISSLVISHVANQESHVLSPVIV